MNTLFFLIFGFLVYLAYAKIRFGWTRSVSNTYGRLSKIQQLLPYIVLILCIVIPFTVLGLHASEGKFFSFLWWVGMAFLIMVGMFPSPKSDSWQEKAHVIGATGGLGFYTAAAILTLDGILPKTLGILFILFTFTQTYKKLGLKIKNNTYWIEVVWGLLMTGALYFAYYPL